MPSSDQELQLRAALSQALRDVERCQEAVRSAKQALQAAVQRKEQLETELEDLEVGSVSSEDWETKQPWSEKLRKACEEIFGVTSFRTNQEEAMNALLSKRDVFLVAPTGAGKSLCFQAPALVTGNLTLVVSPLLSLMQDQVMSLRAVGVGAAMLSNSDSREEQTRIRKAMSKLATASNGTEAEELRVLYLTPERLAKSKLVMNLLEKIYAAGRMALIAIDEAHCISQWGHDFRPDYEKLAALRIQFPKTPILALTATATRSVAADVQKCLNLTSVVELRAATNRSNLFYAVRHRPKDASEVLAMVLKTIKLFPAGTPGLVYCITRKEAECLREGLSQHVPCAFYHGDLTAEARQKVHSSWVEGNIHVVVATVAFGMGINKADVRFVIHAGLPASLHHYYQESGRAGRDGKAALCLVLYRPSDVTRHSAMNYYKPQFLREIYGVAMYCQRRECRRQQISRHFGEAIPECRGGCDVCAEAAQATTEPKPPKRQRQEKREVPAEAWRAACEVAVAQRGKEEQLTLVKLGDRVQKACKWRGEPAGEDALYVVMSLLGTGYFREEFRHSPYTTNAYLVATLSADGLLDGQKIAAETLDLGSYNALLHSPVDPGRAVSVAEKFAALRRPTATDPVEVERLRCLRQLRSALGRRTEVPGQFILTDGDLAQLTRKPPELKEDLPLSAAKRKLYGDAIISCLAERFWVKSDH